MASADDYDSKTEEEAKGDQPFVQMWLDAISHADEEEKDWRKRADDVVDIYRGKEAKGSRQKWRFNILYSNVETISAATYNSTPIPDVRRRYSDSDPVGKDVATIIERALSFSVDTYDFDAVMKAVVRDGEVPGRGMPRVRYLPSFGEPTDELPEGAVTYEQVRADYVPWKWVRRGPGTTWADIPWLAYGDFLTKEELEKLNPDLADKVPLNYTADKTGDYKKDASKQSIFKRALVWQIWDKESRKVISICPDYVEQPLAIVPDPLGLTDFYPSPRPYQPVLTTDSLEPVIPYSLYEELVTELNDVQGRITKLVKQLRPRGGYAGNASDIKAISEAGDGELVPLTNVEQLLDGSGGIDKAITWFPMDATIGALAQLVDQRERIKQTIYEVTGISDILRGASNAGETATAQQIKSQWGSLRIQERQSEASRIARDVFRIKAEIIAAKFSPEQLQLMTGVQITHEIMQVLQDDLLRTYRIDVETDSTIRGDITRNQEQMANFVQGTAQYAQAMGPLVQQFPPMLQPAVDIYQAFARQFKLGKQAEDALENLSQGAAEAAQQAQAPQEPDPAVTADIEEKQARLQMDQQTQQATLAQGQQKHEMEMAQSQQKHEADLQEKAARFQLDLERHQNEQAAIQHQQMMGERDMSLKAAAHNKKLLDEATVEANAAQIDDAREPTRLEQSMQKLDQAIAMLAQGQQALAQSIQVLAQAQATAQAEDRNAHEDNKASIEMLAQAIIAPRKKTLIRDNFGKAQGVIEEVAGSIIAPRKKMLVRDKAGKAESIIDEVIH